jgi:hypothetical protein
MIRTTYAAVVVNISWLGAAVKSDNTEEKQAEKNMMIPSFDDVLLIPLRITTGVKSSTTAMVVVKIRETAVTARKDPNTTFLSAEAYYPCISAEISTISHEPDSHIHGDGNRRILQSDSWSRFPPVSQTRPDTGWQPSLPNHS